MEFHTNIFMPVILLIEIIIDYKPLENLYRNLADKWK